LNRPTFARTLDLTQIVCPSDFAFSNSNLKLTIQKVDIGSDHFWKMSSTFFEISPKVFSSFLPIKFTYKIKYLISFPVKPEVMSHQKYRLIFLTKFHPQIYPLVLQNVFWLLGFSRGRLKRPLNKSTKSRSDWLGVNLLGKHPKS
jgi:hypothetical protein